MSELKEIRRELHKLKRELPKEYNRYVQDFGLRIIVVIDKLIDVLEILKEEK